MSQTHCVDRGGKRVNVHGCIRIGVVTQLFTTLIAPRRRGWDFVEILDLAHHGMEAWISYEHFSVFVYQEIGLNERI